MYHIDKLMPPSADVEYWRNKANKAASATASVPNDVLRKRGLLGRTDNRDRIEFGTVETHLGTVVVSHDRGADIIELHGVRALLIDIKVDLRMALTSVSAAFAAAQTDEEQAGQKAALAAVVDSVLREHPALAAKVKAAVDKQRYD